MRLYVSYFDASPGAGVWRPIGPESHDDWTVERIVAAVDLLDRQNEFGIYRYRISLSEREYISWMQNNPPLSVRDLALAFGAGETGEGRHRHVADEDLSRLQLPIVAPCSRCNRTIHRTDSLFPTRTGYVRCLPCLRGTAFYSVREYQQWVKDRQL